MDAGIAAPIISRPCFEVSHNGGPTLNELQSVVTCVCLFFAKAGENIIPLPARCLCPRADWEHPPLKEPSFEFDILSCNCAGLLRCKRSNRCSDSRHVSSSSSARNNSQVPRFLRSTTAATACFVLSKQQRFCPRPQERGDLLGARHFVCPLSLYYYQGAERQTAQLSFL